MSDYYNAPVVCAEGTSASHEHGSHGAIHTATTEMLVPKQNWNSTQTTTASYEKVRDGVTKAHAKAFPFSACSKKCISKQLDKFYKDKRCDDLTVKKIGTNPDDVNPATNDRDL